MKNYIILFVEKDFQFQTQWQNLSMEISLSATLHAGADGHFNARLYGKSSRALFATPP